MRRRPSRSPWQKFLLGIRDLLHLDLGVTAMAARNSGPVARKILFAPALTLLWFVDRLLSQPSR